MFNKIRGKPVPKRAKRENNAKLKKASQIQKNKNILLKILGEKELLVVFFVSFICALLFGQFLKI